MLRMANLAALQVEVALGGRGCSVDVGDAVGGVKTHAENLSLAALGLRFSGGFHIAAVGHQVVVGGVAQAQGVFISISAAIVLPCHGEHIDVVAVVDVLIGVVSIA